VNIVLAMFLNPLNPTQGDVVSQHEGFLCLEAAAKGTLTLKKWATGVHLGCIGGNNSLFSCFDAV